MGTRARWRLLARDEATAAQIVAHAFGRPPVATDDWCIAADPVAFTNMTTAALARIQGRFADDGPARDWSVFVKTVQPASCSPLWRRIPPEFQARALDELPWRTEVDVYTSSLAAHLPRGVRLPDVYAVEELDDERTAIWMEDVRVARPTWDLEQYGRAARVLGRLAGALPERRVPPGLPIARRDLRAYFAGRITQGVLPALSSDETWQHPLVAAVVDDGLRADLGALVQTVPAILDALDALPRTLAHGDASPQNLLDPTPGPGPGPDPGQPLVAIDWTFAGLYAIGYDLAQLVAGRAESGELEAGELEAIHAAVVPAYVAGAAEQGMRIDADAVAAGYVGALVVRSAFTALPLEQLAHDGTAALRRMFRRRAAYARFVVDLAATLR